MKPPVEAPTSRAVIPLGFSRNAFNAWSSLTPAPSDEGRTLPDANERVYGHECACLVIAAPLAVTSPAIISACALARLSTIFRSTHNTSSRFFLAINA